MGGGGAANFPVVSQFSSDHSPNYLFQNSPFKSGLAYLVRLSSRWARAREVLAPLPLVIPELVVGASPLPGYPVLGTDDVEAAPLARLVHARFNARAIHPAFEDSLLGRGDRQENGFVVLAGFPSGLRLLPVNDEKNQKWDFGVSSP